MEIKRLKSYDFKCPCCSEPHRRQFDYLAKFMGFIPEVEPLPTDREVTMLDRAVMHDQTIYEGSRTMPIGDKVFRCGNCYEYFKFEDNESLPVKLSENEKQDVERKFKPITVVKRNAVMNAVASFDSLLNAQGCVFDEETNEIVIRTKQGKEIRLDIAEQLYHAFYDDNPMFDVKPHERWAYETSADKEENKNTQQPSVII